MAYLRSSSGHAAVVGTGPNGLAAAVTLARAGVEVTVFEAEESIGGGTRTGESVMPGVLHDICSAIHPMAFASPFLREFELARRMEFFLPEASYANPLDTAEGFGGAAIAYRSLERTATELGKDGPAYRRLYEPLLARLDGVLDFTLGGSMMRVPRDPVAAIFAALRTLEQGSRAWNARFRDAAAPALLAGVAAHTVGRLPNPASAAVGLVLGALGHTSGWPVPVGGSQMISKSMADDLVFHGGRILTGYPIEHISELAAFSTVVFDTSTWEMERIVGEEFPANYRRSLKNFRPGDAATKVDFVLDGEIPWADERIGAAPTVHLGGTRREIAYAENEVAKGRHPEKPYVLLAQTSRADPSRNPANRHAIWSYTHVPNGSDIDVSRAVMKQIERFAPGFRDQIVGMKMTTASSLARYNRNYRGGDFSAGALSMRQLLARPVFRAEPWRTPIQGIYLASSATPPGPGVHGLCGWYAARLALKNEYGLSAPYLGL